MLKRTTESATDKHVESLLLKEGVKAFCCNMNAQLESVCLSASEDEESVDEDEELEEDEAFNMRQFGIFQALPVPEEDTFTQPPFKPGADWCGVPLLATCTRS